MPIADAEINKTANTFLVRPAAESVYQALRAWRSTPDHQGWWWLLVEHGRRRYTAVRFFDLGDALNRSLAEMTTRLADLPPRRDNPADWEHPFPGVVTPVVVEQASMGTARALQVMADSPGQVLIVLQDGSLRGILSASTRTFAFTDQPLLDMLQTFEQKKQPDAPTPEPPAPPSKKEPE